MKLAFVLTITHHMGRVFFYYVPRCPIYKSVKVGVFQDHMLELKFLDVMNRWKCPVSFFTLAASKVKVIFVPKLNN